MAGFLGNGVKSIASNPRAGAEGHPVASEQNAVDQFAQKCGIALKSCAVACLSKSGIDGEKRSDFRHGHCSMQSSPNIEDRAFRTAPGSLAP
ncbi:MAG: hypothetical protein J0L51_12725 [Rhizobiales bacterium]|nr:hypothetical protein [Hyphomicrobiales bacterium]